MGGGVTGRLAILRCSRAGSVGGIKCSRGAGGGRAISVARTSFPTSASGIELDALVGVELRPPSRTLSAAGVSIGSGGMRFGTLGGAGFGTLRAGSVRGTGVAVVRGGGSIWWANIPASCRSATSWSSAMGAKGVDGCGCRSAVVSLVAASTAASADDDLGILYKYGKNSTVRAILSALVFVIYQQWHR